jgi:two-component system phosphate regulon response regulator OmpR
MALSDAQILIVEDDDEIARLVRDLLVREGFRVETAGDSEAMRAVMTRFAPDLVILDLMLPGEDGLSICRNLRARGDMPVLMLTAKSDDIDRVVGLEMGADDYLPKPFNPRELVARIHAVLRRQSPSELPGAPSETTEVFEFGEFALNLATRTLTKAGQEIPLTTGEFSVLKVFARHPRQPLSREKLMELARGREYEVFDRSLDVQISRLRKLIEPDPGSPRFIQTVWGLGYVFIPDGAA